MFVIYIVDISRYVGLDKGAETGETATIHAYVRQSHQGEMTVRETKVCSSEKQQHQQQQGEKKSLNANFLEFET